MNPKRRKFEVALDNLEWELSMAIEDVRYEFLTSNIPPSKAVSALLYEAEGIVMDGKNPAPFLIKELKRWL